MYKILTLVIGIISIIIYYSTLKNVINPEQMRSSYDFIIIGAGSAGAVVATRLSEHPEINILLLEAGSGPPPLYSNVPLLVPFLQASSVDWQYFTEPQKKACTGQKSNKMRWPRGKTLGGSSILNYMMYHRGHKENYDYWAELGNDDWSYEKMLPYFMLSESNVISSHISNGFHGDRGWLTVSYPNVKKTKVVDLWRSALHELKYPTIDDCNNPNTPEGFTMPSFVIKNGMRCSTYECYLKNALDRPNLDVLPNAHVTKINVDDNNRATGVEFIRDATTYSARTHGEVLVSGGAVNSPQLLLLSGIGDKQHLMEQNIPLVMDLPAVGQNLIDHVIVEMKLISNETIAWTEYDMMSVSEVYRYLRYGTGLYSSSPLEYMASFDSGTVPGRKNRGFDLQLYLTSAPLVVEQLLSTLTNFREDLAELTAREHWDSHGRAFSACVSLQMPESKGSIRLKSNNPLDHPIIDANYLDSYIDVKTLIKGWRMLYKLLDTKVFKRYGVRLYEPVTSECKDEQFTDAYLECSIRSRVNTLYHPMGTCRMGNDSATSVVDAQLKYILIKLKESKQREHRFHEYHVMTCLSPLCVVCRGSNEISLSLSSATIPLIVKKNIPVIVVPYLRTTKMMKQSKKCYSDN